MQPGSFGQRGATLNGAQIGGAAAAPALIPQTAITLTAAGQTKAAPDWSSGASFAVVIPLAICALGVLEAMLSNTALITPISNSFLWTMRLIGVAVGLVAGVVVASTSDFAIWRKLALILFSPLLVGFLFDGIGWRMADWRAFGFSSQPFAPASYPIENVSRGRKGRTSTVSIDPFATGESTRIPISREQYSGLRADIDGLCVTVQQRRSPAGEIEILTDGQFTLSTPDPVEITPCGGSVRAQTNSANPWSN